MEQINALLKEILTIDLINITISGVRGDEPASKIKIRPVLMKKELYFQATSYIDTKVIHSNDKAEAMAKKIAGWMEGSYKQMQITTGTEEISVLVSKRERSL